MGVLAAYNLVTGYLYNKEADRKRMRLNEQMEKWEAVQVDEAGAEEDEEAEEDVQAS